MTGFSVPFIRVCEYRYHSHPRMIAIPSHVDVRTQRDYQAMDPGFVGLIVSLFNQSNAAVRATREGD
jgi:hypothetical protein